MKNSLVKSLFVSSVTLLLASTVALAIDTPKPETLPAGQHLYVIEREMPGVGKLTPADLKAASQKSCSVLQNLGPQITWVQSYVTGDKLYCVYLAPNAEMVPSTPSKAASRPTPSTR